MMLPTDATHRHLQQTRPHNGCAPVVFHRPDAPGAAGSEWKDLRFGVAETSALGQASALVERMYARRGYRTGGAKPLAESPHRITFAGTRRGRLFATLTLGLDSPDGLLVDALYRAEVDAFRAVKRRICELSTFAIDPRFSSHRVLGHLFRLAYVYGRIIHHATDAFIEVNPRHVGFYERIFRFRRIGEMRHCPRVEAPAVLLHLDLEHLDARTAADDETPSPRRLAPAH